MVKVDGLRLYKLNLDMSIHKIDYIPSETQANEFDSFLKRDNNAKLIFSAKFGSGKTTFLRKFFENNEQYIPIFIYPVNYSVVSDKDIFELIKYDILLQLLSRDDIGEYLIEIQGSLASELLLVGHPENIISTLLKTIPSLGTSVRDVLGGLLLLKESLEESDTGQKEKISKIADLVKTDNAFESNNISTLICSIIKEFKKQNPDKELILIIDDLDRIDPSHIFRIMNVFAAHNDIEDDSRNKFGLHKIITVCDVNNIKSIFHHFYGNNTDFNGYLGKFHNKNIFRFDIKNDLAENIDKMLSQVSILHKSGKRKLTETTQYNLIKPILLELLYLERINIKSILKLPKSINISDDYSDYKGKIYRTKDKLFLVYAILTYILGDKDSIIKSLEICNEIKPYYSLNYDRKDIYHPLSYIIDFFRNDRDEEIKSSGDSIQVCFYKDEYALLYKEKHWFAAEGYPVDIYGVVFKSEYLSTDDKATLLRKEELIPFWNLLLECFKIIEDIFNSKNY